ncbi:MAG: hypothetical protein AAFR65_11165 [Pseudomonadota bacterium]
MSNVETLPVTTRERGQALPVIVPNDLEQAYRMATAIGQSGLAPKSFQTPQAIMVAIMTGLEVGFKPLQALQSIAVVNGKTTIYGDGAIALVRGSGLCGYVKEWIEGEGDQYTAYCETLRAGEQDPVIRSFSVTNAKQAGLWGKQGPWSQYSDRMLQMRARSFCLRDAYADVLSGFGIYEEVRDYDNGKPKAAAPLEANTPKQGTNATEALGTQNVAPAPAAPPPPPPPGPADEQLAPAGAEWEGDERAPEEILKEFQGVAAIVYGEGGEKRLHQSLSSFLAHPAMQEQHNQDALRTIASGLLSS